MSKLTISAHDNGFGASISGADLSCQLSAEETQEIRKAWVKHRVVYFPDQPMNHDQLARFTQSFGGFGDDPYVKSIEEHQNILEVRRDPDEDVAPFGGGWHSDWSFQETPPSATILHSKVIPPLGGDTWYADGIAAYAALDPTTQSEIDDLITIHSARRPYSHEGYLKSRGPERSMTILPNDSALGPRNTRWCELILNQVKKSYGSTLYTLLVSKACLIATANPCSTICLNTC